MKNKSLKIRLLFGIFLLFGQLVSAQKSYIYIELIKTIPCRVIQNGKEVPLLSKNFVILNINDQREQNIDIEFGADLYPKQNFIIDAVPNAAYGYKLARSGESSFYLLDLINNGKIIESNSAVNIGLPTALNTINLGKNQPVRVSNASADKKETWISKAFSKKEKTEKETIFAESQKKENVANNEPKYGVIEVIKSDGSEVKTDSRKSSETRNDKHEPKPVQQIRASCYLVASDKEVESFIEKISAKNDDDIKLLITRKKQFTGCLTVKHIIQAGENFTTQYGRYNFVKIAINNVADPQDLKQCESLFRNDAYKNKFYKLIGQD